MGERRVLASSVSAETCGGNQCAFRGLAFSQCLPVFLWVPHPLSNFKLQWAFSASTDELYFTQHYLLRSHFFLFPHEDPFLPRQSEPLPDSVSDSDLPSISVPKNHSLHSFLTSSISSGLCLQRHFFTRKQFCEFTKVPAYSPESDQASCLGRKFWKNCSDCSQMEGAAFSQTSRVQFKTLP